MNEKDDLISIFPENMINYLLRNWLGFLGLVIGLTGVYFSFYFYEQSKQERKPVFIVDPQRTEILSENTLATAPIKVFTADGREIQSGLISVRFYFWNQGKISIRPSNILESLKIGVEDSNARIVDFKILKTARPISNITLNWDTSGLNKKIALNLDILEQNDGITGQIIYEGNPRSKIIISGLIEGIASIAESENDIAKPSIYDYVKSLSFIWFIGIIVVLGIIVSSVHTRYGPMETWKVFSNTKAGRFIFKIIFKWLAIIIFVFFALVLIVSSFYGVILKPINDVKELNKKTIIEKVPQSILP